MAASALAFPCARAALAVLGTASYSWTVEGIVLTASATLAPAAAAAAGTVGAGAASAGVAASVAGSAASAGAGGAAVTGSEAAAGVAVAAAAPAGGAAAGGMSAGAVGAVVGAVALGAAVASAGVFATVIYNFEGYETAYVPKIGTCTHCVDPEKVPEVNCVLACWEGPGQVYLYFFETLAKMYRADRSDFWLGPSRLMYSIQGRGGMRPEFVRVGKGGPMFNFPVIQASLKMFVKLGLEEIRA